MAAPTWSWLALAAGTHAIKATYAGDATFHSSSGKVMEVVENP